MAPITLILSIALVALGGVDARSDKLRVSQWTSSDCSGLTSTKQLEPKSGHCQKIDARSVMFHAPKKGRHQKWVKEVNSGDKKCWAMAYTDHHCSTQGDVDPLKLEVPGGLEQCENLGEHHVLRSVRFFCEDEQRDTPPIPTVVSTTETMTTWGTAPGNSFIAGLHTTVYNTTLFLYPHPTAVSRAAKERIEPRAATAKEHHHAKGVWLKSPFTNTLLCFECWTKDAGNPTEFECQSPVDWNHATCGPSPSAKQATVSVTTTETRLVYLDSTFTLLPAVTQYNATTTTSMTLLLTVPTSRALAAGQGNSGVEERSEKETVYLENPFARGLHACAKAKWEHAGKADQKITLKRKSSCPKDRSKVQTIDADHVHQAPAETKTFTQAAYVFTDATSTSIMQPTVTTTSTTTAVITMMVPGPGPAGL